MNIDKKSKRIDEQLERIKDLSKRIENTPYGRSPLTEAVGQRIQVTRDQLIDYFNKMDSMPETYGTLISMTYVKAASIYKSKRNWRTDAVTAALEKYVDRSEEDWYQQISNYNKPETKGSNPVWTVVLCSRSRFHYNSVSGFNKKSAQNIDAKDDLRLKYGLPQKFKDATTSFNKSDYGVEQTHKGTLVKRYNSATSKQISPTEAYLLSPDGNIVTKIPLDVVYAMGKEFYNGPEKEAIEILGANSERLKAYEAELKELNKSFGYGTFNLDQIVTCAFGFEGKKYYFINDSLALTSSGSKGINVNPQEWRKIGEDQLEENFTAIEGFESDFDAEI